MKSLAALRTQRAATRLWKPTSGAKIELRQWGNLLRKGTVEDVMPGGHGFWLAAEGASPRLFVHLDYDDIEVWIDEPPHATPRRVA